ncbi:MAG: hypothetical protein HC899_22010 [Leptolyngbyaceae cyanobacterium SM1_4_3]|nr:hypothetical protein [Leptolyngbyaceae cyanobacterium SM1_4_3]
MIFVNKFSETKIYLWTFSGLTAARHLYEKLGFVLDDEYTDNSWGNTVVHQKFTLEL